MAACSVDPQLWQAITAGGLEDALPAVEHFKLRLAPAVEQAQGNSFLSGEQVKLLAREHGSIITGLLKLILPRLEPGLPALLAQALGELACLALHALDGLRPALKCKGLELEVQKYNFVRKLTASGSHSLALKLGLRLFETLQQALADKPVEVCDLITAVVINMVVCTNEVLGAGQVDGPQIIQQIHGPVSMLVQHMSASAAEPPKQAEALFRCLYKLVCLSQEINGVDSKEVVVLQASILGLFMQVASLIGQEEKMPQYVSKMASDHSEPMVVASLLKTLLCLIEDDSLQPSSVYSCMEALVALALRKGLGHIVVDAMISGDILAHPGVPLLVAAAAVSSDAVSNDTWQVISRALEQSDDALRQHALKLQHPSSNGTGQQECGMGSAPEFWRGLDLVRHQLGAAGSKVLDADVACSACLASTMQLMVHLGAALIDHGRQTGRQCVCEVQSAEDILQAVCSAALLAAKLTAIAAKQGTASEHELLRCSQAMAADMMSGLQLCSGSVQEMSADLRHLSAGLYNAGLQLNHDGCWEAAAEMHHLSAKVMAAILKSSSEDAPTTGDDTSVMEKRCKAHINVLYKREMYSQAAATAVGHIHSLSKVVGSNVGALAALIKLHVRGRLRSQQQHSDQPRPPKAPKKSRLQAMNFTQHRPASAPAVALLVQSLIAAAEEGDGDWELAQVLDVYAYQEAVLLQDEEAADDSCADAARSARAAIPALLLQAFPADGDEVMHSRALMLKCMICPTSPEHDWAELSAAASSLDAALAASSTMDLYDVHLLNSTALCHVMLALATASKTINAAASGAQNHSSTADNQGSWSSFNGSVRKALALWNQLMDDVMGGMRCFSAASTTLRYPLLTLQLLTQLWQLLHLQGGDSSLLQKVQQVMAAMVELVTAGGIKLSSQLAMVWSLLRSGAVCCNWAMEPTPGSSLVSDFKAVDRLEAAVLNVVQEMEAAGQRWAECGAASAAAQVEAAITSISAASGSSSSLTSLLLTAQLHHLAAHAHFQQGHMLQAFHHSQESLKLSGALYGTMRPAAADATAPASLAGDEPAAGAGDTPAGPIGSNTGHVLFWLVLSQYLAALYQAAEVFEVCGCAEDASCLLKECSKLARMLGCGPVEVLSLSLMAHTACKQGEVELALSLHGQAKGLMEGSGAKPPSYLQALLSRLEGDVCRLKGDSVAAAAAAYAVGLSTCKQAAEVDSGAGTGPLAWRWRSLQCQLQLQHAKCMLQGGEAATALAQLEEAMCALTAGASSTTAGCCAWPVQQGNTLLHMVVARQMLHASSANGAHGSGSSSSNLLAGVGREGSSQHMQEQQQDIGSASTKASGRTVASNSTKPLRAARATKWEPSKPVTKAAADAAAPPPLPPTRKPPSSHESDGATPGLGAVDNSIAMLLRALQQCWDVPLLVQKICQALLELCWDVALPSAAAMFLHMGLCASIRQQQLLALQLQSASTPSASWQPPVGTASASEVGSSSSSSNSRSAVHQATTTAATTAAAAADTESSLQVLNSALPVVKAMVQSAAVAKSGSSAHQQIEQQAAAWIDGMLKWLPDDCVVTSATSASRSGGLLLTRLQRSRPPLLLQLPTHPSSDAGESTAGNIQQLSASAAAASPAGAIPPSGGVAAGLLSRLGRILEESGESMKGSVSLGSTAEKTQWWKARLALDAQMSELLEHMDQQCLGPWKVLLMPVSESTQRALETPAALVVSKHFSHLSSGTACAVVCEVLVLLMAHASSLDRQALQRAVEALWTAAQQQQQPPDPAAVADIVSLLLSAQVESTAGGHALSGTLATCTLVAAKGSAATQQQKTGSGAVEVARRLQPLPSGVSTSSVVSALAEGVAKLSVQESKQPAAAGIVAAAKRKGTRLAAMQKDSVVRDQAPPAAAPPPPPPPAGRTGRSRAAATAAADSSTGPTKPAATRGRASKVPAPSATNAAVAAPTIAPAPSAKPPPNDTGASGSAEPDCQPAAEVEIETSSSKEDLPDTTQLDTCKYGRASSSRAAHGDGTTILTLEPCLHALPWENIPALRHLAFYRAPSLVMAAAAAARFQTCHTTTTPSGMGTTTTTTTNSSSSSGSSSSTGSASSSSGTSSTDAVAATQPAAGRLGSKAGSKARSTKAAASTVKAVASSTSQPAAAATMVTGKVEPKPAAVTCVDLSSTYFLLNPGGDLVDTQQCFESWFTEQLGWQGIAGAKPAVKDLLTALQQHNLFVYFGHGSGEQYLPLPAMRKLPRCAANLLMGCSSGKLRQLGHYGPAGAVMGYLLAGCPAVVANLWDVTDKDIDRFSQALLKHWMEPGAAETKEPGSAGGGQGDSGNCPQGDQAHATMSAAVASSRSACKLPHLIGAAPVCYGIPTAVAWRGVQ